MAGQQKSSWDVIGTTALVNVETILFALFIFSILVLIAKSVKRPFNFPPGPKGMPLIGYLPKYTSHTPEGEPVNIYQYLNNVSKTFGPVAGFFMGPLQTPFISVCGAEAVKEALNNPDLDGRPDTPVGRSRTAGLGLGILFDSGAMLIEQRRFALRHLRQLGYGKSSSETIIQDEILDLLKRMKDESDSNPNRIVDFKHIFRLPNLNIIWAFIGGKRFQSDDAEFAKLTDSVELMGRGLNIIMALILPVPQKIIDVLPMGMKKKLGACMEGYKPVTHLLTKLVEERIANPSDDPSNYIDIYIQEMKNQENNNGKDKETSFTKNRLIASLVDIFEAGSHTTDNAIGWFMLYMVNYPEVQRKIQEELDEVCGDGLPLLEHRPKLIYLEAALREVQRLRNVAPFVLPHNSMKETQLHGYTIPKDSVLLINLYSVHMDEKYWPDAEAFRPERHISPDGKLIKEMDHFLPFGLGKRACLGDTIARQMYFLFSSAILKTFDIKAIPNEPLPSLNPKYTGFIIQYMFYKATVVPRQSSSFI